ncbi:MAG TPA: hypothetical protein ENJ75_02675 [Candidatus Kaiserbacteria bacterium]|nr:hypothetical protein [Candidatus Kaiserbacteria bacterium]
MTTLENLTTHAWSDYELLDSGENMKLERFGKIILARPETQALWKKALPEIWEKANATFSWEGKKGSWKIKNDTPKEWGFSWQDTRLIVKLTSFKHTGIFPEQAQNWAWLKDRVHDAKNSMSRTPKVLNLFGYTGVASIVSAQAGAEVTHVDASKQSLTWAHKNADASGVGVGAKEKSSPGAEHGALGAVLSADSQKPGSIRYLLDDALSFSKRAVRRGERYDGIILDPPAFGRGAKGEVWHIEKNLPILLELLNELLNDTPDTFFLLNGYASGYAPKSFMQLVESTFKNSNLKYGELEIAEAQKTRVIPAGIYVRFARNSKSS